MKMKTKRKALLLSLCAVLLVVASVMGTMAYLTSTPDAVVNTFTVGKVEISLDEAKVTEYGELVYTDEGKTTLADRVKENKYLLVPGEEYVKDPIVYVEANSEDSWVFVKVENGIANFEAATVEGGYQKIAKQIADNGWSQLTVDGKEVAGVYYKKYDKNPAKVQYPVFGEFTIADDAKWENGATATVKVTAYAIQQAGLTVEEAWAIVGK